MNQDPRRSIAPLFSASLLRDNEQATHLNQCLRHFFEAGFLDSPEVQAASYLALLGDEYRSEVILAGALALRAPRLGHVCIDLASPFDTIDTKDDSDTQSGMPTHFFEPPEVNLWRSILASSPLVTTHPLDDNAPFVLRGQRLYTQRYHVYERNFAHALNDRAQRESAPRRHSGIYRHLFEALFANDAPYLGRQALSAALSLTRALTVISGGPGMGKTYTVRAILVLHLIRQHLERPTEPLRVALVAPSGKAAARLKESLFRDFDAFRDQCMALLAHHNMLNDVPFDTFFEQGIDYSTLHRLLGYQPRTPSRFRHNETNPLPYDLVFIDESSMVDLPMMAKAVAAVADPSVLVLLGDAYQLASVAAGSVLSDIAGPTHAGAMTLSETTSKVVEELCGAKVEPRSSIKFRRPLHESIVHYNRNYRFNEQSGIGWFARQCLRLYETEKPDAGAMVANMLNHQRDDLHFVEHSETSSLPTRLKTDIVRHYRRPLEALIQGPRDGTSHPLEHVATALKLFERYRVLSPHRRGPIGVDGLNQMIEELLSRSLGIPLKAHPQSAHYRGRPILIRQNDYQSGLFNGDIGMVVDDQFAAFLDAEEDIRLIALARLPRHETVYAMTVHSSQGSEFEDVALVLPPKDSPILTRELLYTAITRGRSTVTICGSPGVLEAGLTKTVRRTSGLRDLLWSES